MSQIQNTAKQTNAAQAPQIRKLPSLSLDVAMATAEKLRIAATSNHDQFVVKGRKAELALMADVYALYHGAKNSSDNGTMFMSKVKAKLLELNVKVRKSSPESSQLIRYVCKDCGDKQVSIYGRSLAVAFAKGINPSEYVDFIETTPGGFAGVRGIGTPAAPGSDDNIKAAAAEVHALAEKTVTTIDVTDWVEDEEYRVLIAFRNDDDTANVKNARLSKGSMKAVLLRYEADKNERNKPTKDQDAGINKLALQVLEGEAGNAKVKCENVEADLNNAIANANTEKCGALRVALKVAQLQEKSTESSYKTFKASLVKVPVTA